MRKLLICTLVVVAASNLYALPKGFVYLKSVAPSIQQNMRYHTYHNFVGRPVDGYQDGVCILTQPAAEQLTKVQKILLNKGLSLKVYDCYRPQRAVNNFVRWSRDLSDQTTKQEFYPTVDKRKVFDLGYVARFSGHSRGSTVDLTIVPVGSQAATYHQGQKLAACFAPRNKRFKDNSIDMGAGFDCFSTKSYPMDKTVSKKAFQNRMLLRHLMMKHGFEPYSKEWWHFTLKAEPFPNTYFDFPVKS